MYILGVIRGCKIEFLYPLTFDTREEAEEMKARFRWKEIYYDIYEVND